MQILALIDWLPRTASLRSFFGAVVQVVRLEILLYDFSGITQIPFGLPSRVVKSVTLPQDEVCESFSRIMSMSQNTLDFIFSRSVRSENRVGPERSIAGTQSFWTSMVLLEVLNVHCRVYLDIGRQVQLILLSASSYCSVKTAARTYDRS